MRASFLVTFGAILSLGILVVVEFVHPTSALFLVAALVAGVANVVAFRTLPRGQRRLTVMGLCFGVAVLAVYVAAGLLLVPATWETGIWVIVWLSPFAAAAAVLPLLRQAAGVERAALLAAPAGGASSAVFSILLVSGFNAPVPLIREVDVLTLSGLVLGLMAAARLVWRARGERLESVAPAV